MTMQTPRMFNLSLMLTLLFLVSASAHNNHHHHHNRRLLHQPLFPFGHSLPPNSLPSSPPTRRPPKLHPFFSHFPPTPAPPPPNDLATFPANISSLTLPHSSHSSNSSITGKFIGILISVSVLSAAFITALVTLFFLIHRRDKFNDQERSSDCLRLVSPNATPSHAEKGKLRQHTSSTTSPSEFLYRKDGGESSTAPNNSLPQQYQMYGSPEIHPLPPLPRLYFRDHAEVESVGNDEEEEFFSPGGSSGGKGSPNSIQTSYKAPVKLKSNSSSDSFWNSPSGQLNLSQSTSTDSLMNYPALPRSIFPPVEQRALSPTSGSNSNSPSRISDSSVQIAESSMRKFHNSGAYASIELPMPPAPPPRPRFWEASTVPQSLVIENDGPPMPAAVFKNENDISESMKPKLKPLHWDKVRASSDRAMVWDQLKSSSFQLNEEMIEALFTVNYSGLNSKNVAKHPIIPVMNQEKQVLDLKKSQNIAILLRALQITSDQVCDALLQGDADTLGPDLLESLTKMAPTKEEERKLKGLKDEPSLKLGLGPAEKFLVEVLDIPFAFKRVDALLYMASFDSEVKYLKSSFQTVEAACEELRNSRLFLKLLEAVLRTGNRMNMGTNRGDAHAFKLDTLLKLVDIKGSDGKTTLLHFVLQETIRAEGTHLTTNMDQSGTNDDAKFRMIGLQAVSSLSDELTNVKKAAVLDSDVLCNEVAKLVDGLAKVSDVIELNQDLVSTDSGRKFSESMTRFLNKAEQEIINIQAQEDVAISMLRDLTEYFYGDSDKDEARPIKIFMVVRDFLSILDHVCRNNRENNAS